MKCVHWQSCRGIRVVSNSLSITVVSVQQINFISSLEIINEFLGINVNDSVGSVIV